MFRVIRQAGADETPVVDRQLLVKPVDLWLLEGCLHHGCAQIVRHHLMRHAAESLEGKGVAEKEGRFALIEAAPAVGAARVAQPGAEDPGLAPVAALLVPGEPEVPEVHLHHLAGDRRSQHHRVCRLGEYAVGM